MHTIAGGGAEFMAENFAPNVKTKHRHQSGKRIWPSVSSCSWFEGKMWKQSQAQAANSGANDDPNDQLLRHCARNSSYHPGKWEMGVHIVRLSESGNWVLTAEKAVLHNRGPEYVHISAQGPET
jgi:hypothetical protein